MSEAWLLVTIVGGGTILAKGAGPVLLGRRPLGPRLGAMIALLAPTLLAALLVTQTLATERRLVLDARAAGLAAAAIALAARAPTLVVIAVAAATAAIVRLA
ncbi:MAG: AzlD domain-containing protein [Actinomycetota bacterium]|nr:AzlD domain-containing protein [Actinomycetota bacterium]